MVYKPSSNRETKKAWKTDAPLRRETQLEKQPLRRQAAGDSLASADLGPRRADERPLGRSRVRNDGQGWPGRSEGVSLPLHAMAKMFSTVGHHLILATLHYATVSI